MASPDVAVIKRGFYVKTILIAVRLRIVVVKIPQNASVEALLPYSVSLVTSSQRELQMLTRCVYIIFTAYLLILTLWLSCSGVTDELTHSKHIAIILYFTTSLKLATALQWACSKWKMKKNKETFCGHVDLSSIE